MNYRDGKLYYFKATKIKVVKVTDGPQCWEKRKGDPIFRHVFPPPAISEGAFKLVLQPATVPDYVHWTAKVEAEFLDGNIDRDILEAMSRYRYEHWRMCALAMRADGTEMIRANPGLAYLVASNNLFAGRCSQPWRRARSMMRWKRTRILGSCGFPDKESVVRIMSRIDPAILRYPLVVAIRRVLCGSDPRAKKQLTHMPRITLNGMRILNNPEWFSKVTGGFLAELVQPGNEGMGIMFNEVLRMGRAIGEPLGQCRNWTDLRRIHDQLATETNQAIIDDGERKPLPRPPIPDLVNKNFEIRHIADTIELAEWAQRQRNCLASYQQEALSGHFRFYRITKPEEASLSLVRRDGQWQINELAGKDNCPVSEMTRMLVENWMRDC